ncbi:hypothetical protein COX85_02825 [Candidatus Micrarchaeota archaeon CG_4_10_14_0_2_um_filter_55_9]|nr:MAG: hypothetical protein AUJ15_01950 [Candidatus Micrarchaeota archaeon CG1_02_55_41]PIO03320.1 MAG: hypothetical protein COT57_00770 [Candidatus Micrarchaeota archaeon CG09_land_8_20_14_0_10_55_25]PIZ91632.1 MAG: hypothetical protein COX85_02825 [Candidatus Micrarchaeota archaeon CG_4_10_14_0_2_um_filter_55_9]PJD00896.1 MAG: hypothetical protein COU38_03900 [Candidatus Micrarchaeota archaeon CG10_big_fil_rev_8_21_14_0_10_54_18]
MKVNQSMLLFALVGLVVGGAAGYWYGVESTKDSSLEYLAKGCNCYPPCPLGDGCAECIIGCIEGGGSPMVSAMKAPPEGFFGTQPGAVGK